MRIRVRLFASLKDVVGESEIDITVEENSTARTVFHRLQRKFPELERYERTVLVAVNQQYAPWDTLMGEGDEVVFFPPVSGGRP